ncbi:MAG: molybdopterin-binding/glycosyltransferase family 2 protein [Granulosicoccus sp.]|nr:molybdopterin-binding/glycosyltransferase family 2 protein [Granulosicoccus sp.]
MYFGSVSIEECEGCILAHSFKSAAGRIRKGQLLDQDHIALIRSSGVSHVTVARLDNDDIHEDTAAYRIAESLSGRNVRLGAASTGRVNLHAINTGLCEFDAATIHAINLLHEDITVATLPGSSRVVEGQIIATVKIIPFAAQSEHVTAACSAAKEGISVLPTVPAKAVLIQTRLPALSDSALDKASRVTEHRLLERSCTLIEETRVDHTSSAVVAALQQALATEVDWIIIFGASAISDRDDIVPAAIAAAGGTIERFGMPMDPGNLLLLANLQDKTVIGMPGCARSPKYNGLDKVLDRLASKAPISNHWIASLGVGGLLSEIPDRPRPRVVVQEQPKITALILAAGSSTRFGESNKLLAEWKGRPLLQHVIAAASDSRATSVSVVTGFDNESVESQATASTWAKPVQLINNPAFVTGMASSLVKGVSASLDSDAIIVCLADMPNISSGVIDRLIDAFLQKSDKAIYVPVVDGQRGNPVLITRKLFDSILSLVGDTGARVLAQQFPDSVVEVNVEDTSIFQDVDTKRELDAINEAAKNT